MTTHHFLSYSSADALDFALRMCDALAAHEPSFKLWLDKRHLRPGEDWDEQLAEAIKTCESLIFVMTRDSVQPNSVCKQEWTRALKYKKTIIPLRLHGDAELPFRLEPRQWLDFTGDFENALAKLRLHLQWLDSPAGVLQALEDRLADAQRDLQREQDPQQRTRIQTDLALLQKQIAEQQRVADDPEAARERVAASIAAGLEREREPHQPISGAVRAKFINPPPFTAPSYFQDRYVETKLIGDFLQDDSQRLLMLVGRGGTGKTALACRLLKALEAGHLPDELGPLAVDGIVYLSALGSRRLNLPDLYADLLKLLPPETAKDLESIYKNPQAGAAAKMRALLAAFPQGRVIVLLDNFEDVVEAEALHLRDAELEEALTTLLQAPAHAVKVLITTRVAPRQLSLVQPARQTRLDLDKGLDSPFAENILREMDKDGKVSLKTAPEALLAEARERTRGFPRALEALFAILSADRDTTLAEILDIAATRSAAFQTAPPSGARLPENVVRDLVGEAFDRLDLTAQRVMQALAIYRRPVTATAVDYLLQPFVTGVNSAPVLSRLVSMHFVRKEAGGYYLHPVDREYALGRVPHGEAVDREVLDDKTPFTQIALADRGANYFSETRLPRANWKTLADLAPQLAEIDLRCAAEDFDTAAEVLTDIDFDYLLLWGHYRLMIELHENLQGKLDDQFLIIRSGNSLGLANQSIGQIQKAIFGFERALTGAREMKKRQAEGALLGNLGNCYSALGQTQRAIEFYEQALAIRREIGDRAGEGADLGNLGICYDNLGQTRRAIEFHEQALAISREIGDRRGEGNDLGNLGTCYSALGQTRRAIEFHEQALAIAREIGDRRGEGADLGNLGLCYSALGQTQRAIEYYEQALAISREIGNRTSEGNQLGNLGLCYSALGQTRRAIEFYEQALAIAREIGDRRGEGTRLGNLAEMLIDEGRYAEAIKLAQESAKIKDEIGQPASYGYGRVALAQFYIGNLPAAREAAETARRHDVPENNHNVLALLGVIALRQTDRAAAQEAFTAAVQHAEQMVAHSAENYDALDAKGLSLSGLALCEGAQHVAAAMAAFRAARAINQDAGIVKRVLRLFDELAKVDVQGLLKEVRPAAAGA
ncbi:MAG: Photosystem I assembly protein Ycf3 [bacterium]|nr:Photosystem I assembly protein Ycf3 [bacterium]